MHVQSSQLYHVTGLPPHFAGGMTEDHTHTQLERPEQQSRSLYAATPAVMLPAPLLNYFLHSRTSGGRCDDRVAREAPLARFLALSHGDACSAVRRV